MVSSSPRSCSTSSAPRRPGRLTAAVGVVAVGPVPARPSRSVAGDVTGIAFNAQAVTVAAQIVAAEASWGHWRAGGRRAGDRPGRRRAGLLEPVGGTGIGGGRGVAGRMPALRVRRSAGGRRSSGNGRRTRAEAAARGRGGGGRQGGRPSGGGREAGPGRAGGGRVSWPQYDRVVSLLCEPLAVATRLRSDEHSKGRPHGHRQL